MTLMFKIRGSTEVYLTVHELNNLCNAFEEPDDKFEEKIKEATLKAIKTKESQVICGGGILDLTAHPSGLLTISKDLMCLQPTESITMRR